MSHLYYKPAKSRLQRSELAVPGSSPKMFEKALNSNADYVFLDLEDAVSPNDNKLAFFYSMMDILDWILAKTNQRITKFYEECLGDDLIKKTGENLRNKLSKLIQLNSKLIPKFILEQRKDYRDRVRIRNSYAEVLNILQADILKKINNSRTNKRHKKVLKDALLITIAGIAAAMKNVG